MNANMKVFEIQNFCKLVEDVVRDRSISAKAREDAKTSKLHNYWKAL
jgi:hypothetical protein